MKTCVACSIFTPDSEGHCPKCGGALVATTGDSPALTPAPETPPPARTAWIPWGLVGFLSLVFIGLASMGSFEPGPSDAQSMCEQFVKDRLTSPATARFSSDPTITPQALESRSWLIVGYVDSQNSFGAMLRSNYTCHVGYLGEKKWHTYEIEIRSR